MSLPIPIKKLLFLPGLQPFVNAQLELSLKFFQLGSALRGPHNVQILIANFCQLGRYSHPQVRKGFLLV